MTGSPRHSARRGGTRRKITVEQTTDPAKLNHSACADCDAANAAVPHVVFGYYLKDGSCAGVIACARHRRHIFDALRAFEGGHDGDPRAGLPQDARELVEEYLGGKRADAA